MSSVRVTVTPAQRIGHRIGVKLDWRHIDSHFRATIRATDGECFRLTRRRTEKRADLRTVTMILQKVVQKEE